MKTLRILSLFIIALLSMSCGRDDDQPEPTSEPTTKDLLISGNWYLQSGSHVTTTACERKSYYKFNADGSIIAQSHGVNAGTCTDYGQLTGSYTLVGDMLTITANSSGTVTLVKIKSINNETMVFEGNSTGEVQTLIFDKTEG